MLFHGGLFKDNEEVNIIMLESGAGYRTFSTIGCVMRHIYIGPCKSIDRVQGGCYFVGLLPYKLVNKKGRGQLVFFVEIPIRDNIFVFVF